MARDHRGEKNPMYGKSHTPETKAKMSRNRKGKGIGNQNAMRGHCPECRCNGMTLQDIKDGIEATNGVLGGVFYEGDGREIRISRVEIFMNSLFLS